MVSPTPPRFEPELEELLREIARDPRSSLLRIERPPAPIDLADSWEALSRWTPGLTAAEKHLIDVHRSEAARLLRERWLHEVTVRPRRGICVARSWRISETDQREGALEAVATASKGARTLEMLGVEDRGLTSLLDRERSLDSSELTQVLVAAERIAPSSVGKIYLACDRTLNLELLSSANLLLSVFSHERNAELQSHIWLALASVAVVGHDLRRAARCYARAFDPSDPRMIPLASWFLFSMQAGEVEQALLAGEVLDDLLSPENPSLARYCAEQTRTREEGGWGPTPTASQLLMLIESRVGETARRIVDVLR